MPPIPVNNKPAPPTDGTVNSLRGNPSLSQATPTGLTMELPTQKQETQPVAEPTVAPVQPTPAQSIPQASQQTSAQAPVQTGSAPLVPPGLDPTAFILTKAIAMQEGGGKLLSYDAASGDTGATPNSPAGQVGGGMYQFMPATWKNYAQQVLGNPNAPMTPENQNKVAYTKIKQFLDAGYSPAQAASMWNTGEGSPNAWQPGTVQKNGNTPQYAANVQKYAEQLWTGQTPQTQTQNTLPTYGATFAASPNDNLLVGGLKTLGNIPSSLYGVASGLVGMVAHPVNTLETLGSGIIGGAENLTGQNAGIPDQYQQVANSIGSALMNRYGSLAALKNTVENDPVGFAADVAGLVAGGEGLARTGASALDLATGSRAAMAAENAANYARTGLNVMPQVGAARAAVDTGVGALNRGIANVAGTLATPVTAPLRSAKNALFGGAVNEDLAAATARTGIELSPSAYTNNQLINLGDALAATGAGETQFARRLMQTETQMHDLAAKTVAETMGTTDLQTAGENIAKGAQAYGDSLKAQTDALYGTFRNILGGDVAAQTARSTQLLSDAIAKMESVGDTNGLKYLKDKLNVLRGTDGFKPPTLTTLKDLLSSVGEKNAKAFGDPEASSIGNTLKGLYGALKEDTRQTLAVQNKPGLLQAYDAANASAVEGYQALSTAYAKKVRNLVDSGQQDKIVSTLIRPTMSTSDIPRIMEMAGEQGAADIRANFLQNIFDAAKDKNTGNFTPSKINAALKKWGYNTRDDKVTAILGSNAPEIQQIKDLGTLSEGTAKLLDFKKGASDQFLVRTALRLKPFGEAGLVGFGGWKILTGDIAGGIELIAGGIGMEGASRFLASDAGQRLMRLGIQRGVGIAAEAQKQGFTIPQDNGNMGGNGVPNNGFSTPTPGGGISESIPGSSLGSDTSVGNGTAMGAKLKTVELNALAKEQGFNINAARQNGFSEQDIQDHLLGKNAGQLQLPEGNPNAVQGPTITLPTSAREQTLGLNETKNAVMGPRTSPETPKTAPASSVDSNISPELISAIQKAPTKEAFLKSQKPVYHATPEENVASIEEKGLLPTTKRGEGAISFSGNKKTAEATIRINKGNVGATYERYISPDAKLMKGAQFDKLVGNLPDATNVARATAEAKSLGYDGVDFRKSGKGIQNIQNEVRVWNTDKLLTKSQLSSLYDQVKGKK